MSRGSRRVVVEPTGKMRPIDPAAVRELRKRGGDYELLPAPPGLLILRGVKAERAGALRLAGEIATPGALIDIVSLVGHAAWRGELIVFEGAYQRSIDFEQGYVMSAQSTVDYERLGPVLCRYGVLSQAQVNQAKAVAKEKNLRFGEVIISLGFLNADQLYRYMTDQTDEILRNALHVERGMFYFFDGFDDSQLSFVHRRSVTAVLTDVVRRMDEMKYFRERIPGLQHIPERLPGRTPPEGELEVVYAAIDGKRSVEELGRALKKDEFAVTRSLFELCQKGYVAVRPPRPRSSSEIVQVFNQAIRLVLQEMDSLGRGDDVREELTSYAAWSGVYEALFEGAGPFDDGTLDPERIEQNIGRLSSPGNAERQLAEWLHEYASFAMFLARPHMSRAEDEGNPASVRNPEPQRRVSQKIRAVLSSIAPEAPDEPSSSRERRG